MDAPIDAKLIQRSLEGIGRAGQAVDQRAADAAAAATAPKPAPAAPEPAQEPPNAKT